MYSKLAFRNLKRSFKDYAIYFLTLVFGVCIFYTFNSIQSQSIMLELNEVQAAAFEQVDAIMGYASTFVSFVLAFLIIYANNYLIKRRKKEFGIYMTLGMDKGNLSIIIFFETLLVGIISLAVGLAIGIILSQGLSVLTAKMFQVNFLKFKFVFSYNAMIKTFKSFGIIYILVLIFNSISIRKIQLIDLLNSSKKNENIKVRNVWVSVVLFLISLIMIGSAYYIVLDKGTSSISMNVNGKSILLGIIGTFLFFFSLSGFLLKLAQSNRKFYLKELNMFVLRQINSKINTVFISMSFICLSLFIGICMLAGGLGINSAINSDLKDLTQYDETIWSYEGEDIEEYLINRNINIRDYSKKYVSYINYKGNLKYSDLLSEKDMDNSKDLYPIVTDAQVQIITLSKFNEILKMVNKKPITLNDGEYALFSDIDSLTNPLNNSLMNNREININGNILKPGIKKTIEVVAYNQMMKSNLCTVVVKDDIVTGLTPWTSFLNFDYNEDNGIVINEKLNIIREEAIKEKDNILYSITKEELIASSTSTGAIISYLGIYIGGIFLIVSAAVLALQQLSESTDNIARYNLLKKIGVDEEIINKSLLTQIAIYFLMPLSLALIHSIAGLEFSKRIITLFGSISIMKNILIALAALILIYGGYFIATYLGAKKNINNTI
ncbi:ABC transporter permease [Clostridium sp. Sa3CUN1]|uniref:ABC transporter permease n=1 Tax=Clostridium gallinarum TaxID=2762246 RepID=A0ABR8Q4Y9_9CLOT|nr:ABC transporter permease [Clostridium gallinarum]MBD7915465.1 ABC transporter permease [Clostridium gallinarum]